MTNTGKLSDMQVGDNLPNGAILLQAVARGANEHIVLALYHREYVTWVVYQDDPASTSHGRYHGSGLSGALRCYQERYQG